jgi:hypothetical protein
MSKTKRLSYRLREGEAIVVGPCVAFERLVKICDAYAQMDEYYDAEERRDWQAAADWLNYWISKTAQVED